MSFRSFLPALAAAGLLVAAGCDDQPAEQFLVTGTGSVNGQLFFDADDNGVFDPLGGDELLSGVAVELRERGTDNVLQTTTTDARGQFGFSSVDVGTHDVYVVATPETTGELVFCINPVEVSVYRDEAAFVNPQGKVACVVDILEAEDQSEGTFVIVRGVVTAPPGTYRNDNLYIQDETSGIQVFSPNNLDVQLGQQVEVRGEIDIFGGEIQIGGGPELEVLGTGVLPAPTVATAGELADVTDPKAPIVGTLVKVEAVSVGTFSGSSSGENATITDATGTSQIRLDNQALTTIGTDAFAAGTCYDITGVLGIFNGNVQLKPRTLDDVDEVPCP